MGKSQETFNKKEKEKKKRKKKEEKLRKKEERKNEKNKSFDDMIAYVDKEGNISDTPPDPVKKKGDEVNAEDIVIGVPKKDEALEEAEKIKKGKVTFFNDSKGYGFIKERETGESIFFHVNGLIDDVEENDKVEFETEKGPKGLNAVQVKLLD